MRSNAQTIMAKQRKANVSDNQIWDQLAAHSSYRAWWTSMDKQNCKQYYIVPYKWPNAVYFVSSVKRKSNGRWLGHDVYRLPTCSTEEAFRDSLAGFIRFLDRGQSDNPGLKYELIYSDPPAKPAAK